MTAQRVNATFVTFHISPIFTDPICYHFEGAELDHWCRAWTNTSASSSSSHAHHNPRRKLDMLPFASSSSTGALLRAASINITRPLLLRPPTRAFTSSPSRSLAAPPPPTQSETEELNEAQRYLANKAARKLDRSNNPTGASARHASLYSQLFPALLRILAYGSSAYFGLHLLWNVLDRDEQTKLMNAQTSGLESTARSLVEKVDQAKERVQGAVCSAVSEGKEEAEKAKGKRWYWPF